MNDGFFVLTVFDFVPVILFGAGSIYLLRIGANPGHGTMENTLHNCYEPGQYRIPRVPGHFFPENKRRLPAVCYLLSVLTVLAMSDLATQDMTMVRQ